MFFVIDVTSSDQMIKMCEPLFMLGGKVHRDVVVTLDDLKNGLLRKAATKKYLTG